MFFISPYHIHFLVFVPFHSFYVFTTFFLSDFSFYLILFPLRLVIYSFYCMGVCHVIPSLIPSTFIQRLLVERLMSFHWSCFIVPSCLEICSFIVILVCLSLFHSVLCAKKKKQKQKTKTKKKQKKKQKNTKKETKKKQKEKKKKRKNIYK